MPKLPNEPISLSWRLTFAALGVVVAVFVIRRFVQYPQALAFALFLFLGYVIFAAYSQRRRARLVAARSCEDIGTFARAFDRRSSTFDPWIIRATWDELASWLPGPVRPSDSLAEIYRIVDEDVDDLITRIATRSGRSIEDTSGNPYRGRLGTVGDVVQFVAHQPRLPAA